MSSAFEVVDLATLRAAHEAIRPHIVRTPILTSDYFDNALHDAGVRLFFKAELFQRTGAFKVRGALNAVLAAKQKNPDTVGIVTQSSGNHGAATAYASGRVGLKAAIVVPSFATAAKLSNIARYGAEIIKTEPIPQALHEKVDSISKERNYSIIHPYNQAEVIAGQGTCAVEFVEDSPEPLDAILAPVSGGGLLSGLALGAKHLNPKIKSIIELNF